MGAVRGIPRGFDDDRLHALARARARSPLRRLRIAVALVGRRPRGVLVVRRRLLRHPAPRRPQPRPRRPDDAGRRPGSRALSSTTPRRSSSGSPPIDRRSSSPRSASRSARSAARSSWRRSRLPLPAFAGSASGRATGSPPSSPTSPRPSSPWRLRQHRRDLVELLARFRDPEPGRPVRPDHPQGPHRRRRLHVWRQGVRSRRGHRRAESRTADAAADDPRPVSRPRGLRRRPRRDDVDGPARRTRGAPAFRARAVRPSPVGRLLVGDDGFAEGDRPRPWRRRPRTPQGGRPDVRHPRRRPDVVVHHDRLDDVELPRRVDARRWRPGAVRRQSRLSRSRRRCGGSRRTHGSSCSGRAPRSSLRA